MTIYAVRLGDTTFAPAEQTGQRWKDALSLQYQLGEHGICGCMGRGDKKLAIRAYQSGSYGLAKFPNSGEEHATNCGFHAASAEKSGRRCYGAALSESADGLLRMQLPLGLSLSEPRLEPSSIQDLSAASTSRTRMTLLGLLHLLWQEAGLNTWWPRMEGRRHLSLVNFLLDKAAEGVRCGKVRLSSHMLIGAFKPEQAASVRAMFDAACKLRCRLLTPMVLPRWSVDTERRFGSGVFTGRPFHGLPHLDLHPSLWEDTARRFPSAIAHWRKGGMVACLLQHEPVGRGRTAVVAIALMCLTEQWIPVESAYEAQLAQRLVHERRAFNKPLRYDAGREEVFPDFILLDSRDGRQVPMEVFGLTSEAYLARKAQKVDYYDRVFGVRGWWSWDATAEAMPALPGR